MLIMPSGEDPDHLPMKAVLDKKSFGDKCQYRRFDDMHHGFCAARYLLLLPRAIWRRKNEKPLSRRGRLPWGRGGDS